MRAEPTDIVLLTHDRLEFLARTVEAIRECTPEPTRLIVVDNASGPELRSWLAEHRSWFHQLILRPTNDYVPAFQYGIDATTSDPFIVTDPDVVVPALQPSWLARMRCLMDAHPDFGLIGVDLDTANAPSFLTPEYVAALREATGEVYGDLVEGNMGSHFQLIRRAAWREPYYSDAEACRSVRRAGYRVGYAKSVRAVHLGWDEARHYPHYLAQKHLHGQAVHAEEERGYFPSYANALAAIPAAPTLAQLAVAAPLVARTRTAGVPDHAVLELAWAPPAIGAVVDGPTTLHPPPRRLPDGATAGAVVLLEPPPDRVDELVRQACEAAARQVLLVARLTDVDATLAQDLAPSGWHGSEHPLGDLVRDLAAEADGSSALHGRLSADIVEHREAWLELFSHGAFGSGTRRLFLFEADQPTSVPERVTVDGELPRWQPTVPTAGPTRSSVGFLRRVGRRWRRLASRYPWGTDSLSPRRASRARVG